MATIEDIRVLKKELVKAEARVTELKEIISKLSKNIPAAELAALEDNPDE